MSNRREFLKKLGIGSFVMGSAGIFTLQKPALLVPESASGPEIKILSEETLDLKYTNQEELMKLCSAIFDAIDGKNNDPMIYNAVRSVLTKNSVYEYTDRPEIESL